MQHDTTLTTRPTAGSTFGNYRILREIGRGGMGVVLLARHAVLDRVDALKVLHPGVAVVRGVPERLMREARALSRVAHPHVVRVYDAGVAEGAPYVAMEYLRGVPLSAELARLGAFTPARAVDIALAAACGVAAAHRVGVIHRDLKPANLFLADGTDGVESVKVLDFGVARLDGPARRGADLTLPGDRVGTPNYAAPELVADSRHADARSDQYALGATLAACLLGATREGGRGAAARVAAATLPDGLRAALLRSLADDPAARHPGVRAFAAALLPFASEPARWRRELADDEAATTVMPRGRHGVPPAPPPPPSAPARELAVTEAYAAPEPTARPPIAKVARWTLAVATVSALAGAVVLRGDEATPGDGFAASLRAEGKRLPSRPQKLSPAPTPPTIAAESAPAPVTAPPAPRNRARGEGVFLPDELLQGVNP